VSLQSWEGEIGCIITQAHCFLFLNVPTDSLKMFTRIEPNGASVDQRLNVLGIMKKTYDRGGGEIE
jgi:hypothetical protein